MPLNEGHVDGKIVQQIETDRGQKTPLSSPVCTQGQIVLIQTTGVFEERLGQQRYDTEVEHRTEGYIDVRQQRRPNQSTYEMIGTDPDPPI